MARSHHRKKHKHFQPPPHEIKSRKGAASLFAIGGALIGAALPYFAQANFIWIIAGLVLGALLGYYIGYRIDKSGEKK